MQSLPAFQAIGSGRAPCLVVRHNAGTHDQAGKALNLKSVEGSATEGRQLHDLHRLHEISKAPGQRDHHRRGGEVQKHRTALRLHLSFTP